MGWWEVGGNSTALYAADKARVDGFANFRYDGFAANPITSSSQPCRLVRKAGLTGYIKLNCKNYKHRAGLGLTSGVTQLTIRPWLALAEAVAGVATPHPTLPGESIISTAGLKCKLEGTLFKGRNLCSICCWVASIPSIQGYYALRIVEYRSAAIYC